MQAKQFFACLLVFIAVFESSARGQSTFGSIIGNAIDLTGAVVPGVKVTLSNLATNEQRSALTDAGGLYQFLNLPPATYRLGVINNQANDPRLIQLALKLIF